MLNFKKKKPEPEGVMDDTSHLLYQDRPTRLDDLPPIEPEDIYDTSNRKPITIKTKRRKNYRAYVNTVFGVFGAIVGASLIAGIIFVAVKIVS